MTISSMLGQNTPPVCLWKENPDRLVSLWDIMNLFDCAKLHIVIKRLRLVRGMFDPDEKQGAAALEEWVREKAKERGHTEIPQELQEKLAEMRQIETSLKQPVEEAIEELRKLCESAGFDDALLVVGLAGYHLREGPGPSELRGEIRHLEEALFLELSKRRFLRVDVDRGAFVDNDELFGLDVKSHFPSATFDIREAGNCLAATNNTAAVFHLMRAVEWALRALCVDLGFRRVRKQNKKTGRVTYTPLGWSDWETLLNQLKNRVTERIAKKSRGPKKQLYQEFYYPALQDIEGIKEAWRNHVMHTRREYSPDDAEAIFSHVRRLMEKLATRISE